MPDASWKAYERRIALAIGGQRRGAETRGDRGGKSDVIHPTLAPECKLLGRPSYSAILAACKQAEANAEPGQTPVAFVKRKNLADTETLVVMRLGAWLELNGYEGSPAPEDDDTRALGDSAANSRCS